MATDPVRLCVYDGATQTLVTGTIAPPGDSCAGLPCWRPTPTGFKYADKERTPTGGQLLKLKAGDAGRAKICLRFGGAHVRNNGTLTKRRDAPAPGTCP